ncbi:hypothetical protein EVA_06116 [gut metagenome]|uniref:Uncharacterized protein n=1 Tax=gut metagenome TaxID=749906 RepID=J9GY84_9ZZZZ
MDPEERFVAHWIKLTVELLVVFVCQSRRSLGPKRMGIIDDIVFIGVHLLAVLPFGLLTQGNRHWEEAAVFVEKF